jgi:hypothetical protein
MIIISQKMIIIIVTAVETSNLKGKIVPVSNQITSESEQAEWIYKSIHS